MLTKNVINHFFDDSNSVCIWMCMLYMCVHVIFWLFCSLWYLLNVRLHCVCFTMGDQLDESFGSAGSPPSSVSNIVFCIIFTSNDVTMMLPEVLISVLLFDCDQLFFASRDGAGNNSVAACISSLPLSFARRDGAGNNSVAACISSLPVVSSGIYRSFIFSTVSSTQLVSAGGEWSLSSVARNGTCSIWLIN